MKILINAQGSRGDVRPMLVLCKERGGAQRFFLRLTKPQGGHGTGRRYLLPVGARCQ